jgi:DNA-binding CsgD family transcriptional regulator
VEVSEAAIEMSRLSELTWPLLMALEAQAWVLMLVGKVEVARTVGTEALRLDPQGARYFAAGIRRLVALALLELGDAAAGLDELVAVGTPDKSVVEPGTKCLLFEALTRAELAQGRHEAAWRWARQAEGAAARLCVPESTGLACGARARVLVALGRPEEAITLLRNGVGHLERAGAGVRAARTRIVLADALGAVNRVDEAVGELVSAERGLQGCGLWHAHAHQRLRSYRRRRSSRQRGSGPVSLSQRESEIADLVCGGHSNREIAASLYISEKTVESHLSRIFAKLGVSSRVAVAAVMRGRSSGTDEHGA